MIASTIPDQIEAIEGIIRKINKAWSRARFEVLEQYFHENMIIAPPGFQHRAMGREVCIQSYRDFLSDAAIHDFQESDFIIDIWDRTAVATYQYHMDWESNGKRFQESGHDVYVFTRKDEKWLIVWRTLVPASGNV